MTRFLIEVPHEGTPDACFRAAEILLRTGSHFLTHADWGCMDGEHKAWFIVEVDSKEEAGNIVRPDFRHEAKFVRLNTFTMAVVEKLRRQHAS